MDPQNNANFIPSTLQAQINGLNNTNNVNLMSTLQQLSGLSQTRHSTLIPPQQPLLPSSQIGLNSSEFGGDLSSLQWPAGQWLDQAKMATLLLQSASMNDSVQQFNTLNAMNSFERSFKLLAQNSQPVNIQQPPNPLDQLASTQNSFSVESLNNLLQSNIAQQQNASAPVNNNAPTAELAAQLLNLPSQNSAFPSELQSTVSAMLGLPSSSSLSNSRKSSMSNVPSSIFSTVSDSVFSQHTSAHQSHDHDLQPCTSSSFLNQPSGQLHVDDLDLGDLTDILSREADAINHAAHNIASSSAMKSPTFGSRSHQLVDAPDIDLDHLTSLLNNSGELELDFTDGGDHEPSTSQALRFLKEIAGGTGRDSPEPVNLAELDPVFTPPDSPPGPSKAAEPPQSFLQNSRSLQSAVAHKLTPESPLTLTSNTESRRHSITPDPHSSNAMPLVFIPAVSSEVVEKPQSLSAFRASHKSSLLSTAKNKVPIYKQTLNLNSKASDIKGEDCYDFDDEFEDEPPKPTVRIVEQVEAEHKPEKVSTTIHRRQDPDQKLLYFGTPWVEEFSAKNDADPSFLRSSPFEPIELAVTETPADLCWTADRAAIQSANLRVVVKEVKPEPQSDQNDLESRPRLVLKFMRPATVKEEIPVEPAPRMLQQPPSHFSSTDDYDDEDRSHKSHHHKKKKKHKKKDEDDDYRYPYEKKRRKMEKHHKKEKNRHRSDSLHNGEHNSTPLHVDVSTPSAKTPDPHRRVSNHSASSIGRVSAFSGFVGRLLDDVGQQRYRSFAATRSDLPKGTFIVAKEDLWKEDCPLWRIDSQNLLQKFVPIGDGLYTNSANYTGWCDEIAENYVIISVDFLKQSRAETVVRPLTPIASLFPAICHVDYDNVICGDEDGDSDAALVDEPPTIPFAVAEATAEILLKYCVEPGFLPQVYKLADSKFLHAVTEFQIRSDECKRKSAQWGRLRLDVRLMLESYYGFVPIEREDWMDFEEAECLSCGCDDELSLIGLFGAERYDRDILTFAAEPPPADYPYRAAMNFFCCRRCLPHLNAYHRAHHEFFALFRDCQRRIIEIALQKPGAPGNILLSKATKERDFIRTKSRDIVDFWNRMNRRPNEDGESADAPEI